MEANKIAIINIDRHIFMHIVSLQKRKEVQKKIIEKNWMKISSYFAQENAICDMDKIPSSEIRVKQLKCMRKLEESLILVACLDSELNALLQHIVNAVKEVDTGKGQEYSKEVSDG